MTSEQASESRLADLYLRYAPAAIRLAYLLTGDRALAEDLAHDAFVKVGSRLFAIREPEAFEAYLRRTVTNLAHSHFRRARLERTHAARDHTPVHSDPPDPRDDLWQALRGLPDRQRAAIVLRFYLDLSEQQTADALACRPGTVKSLVSRGLQTLRSEVDR